MTDHPKHHTITRIFDAPRDMVWKAWTTPELLANWYGPGADTTIHKFDLRPGGVWLNEMKWGEKSDLSRMDFQDVIPSEKMVWHQSSTDADWNIITNPMMENWPKTLLTTVTFTETDGKTNLCLTMEPLNATDAEVACFLQAMGTMAKGWGSGFVIIDTILADMQA